MADFIRETVQQSEQLEVETMGRTIDDLIREEGTLTGRERGASKTQEVEVMSKTIADLIKEEGVLEGMERGALKTQRETLLRQLRLKCKRVPAAVEAEINATEDVKKLAGWLDEFATAKALSAMHFSSRS